MAELAQGWEEEEVRGKAEADGDGGCGGANTRGLDVAEEVVVCDTEKAAVCRWTVRSARVRLLCFACTEAAEVRCVRLLRHDRCSVREGGWSWARKRETPDPVCAPLLRRLSRGCVAVSVSQCVHILHSAPMVPLVVATAASAFSVDCLLRLCFCPTQVATPLEWAIDGPLSRRRLKTSSEKGQFRTPPPRSRSRPRARPQSEQQALVTLSQWERRAPRCSLLGHASATAERLPLPVSCSDSTSSSYGVHHGRSQQSSNCSLTACAPHCRGSTSAAERWHMGAAPSTAHAANLDQAVTDTSTSLAQLSNLHSSPSSLSSHLMRENTGRCPSPHPAAAFPPCTTPSLQRPSTTTSNFSSPPPTPLLRTPILQPQPHPLRIRTSLPSRHQRLSPAPLLHVPHLPQRHRGALRPWRGRAGPHPSWRTRLSPARPDDRALGIAAVEPSSPFSPSSTSTTVFLLRPRSSSLLLSYP